MSRPRTTIAISVGIALLVLARWVHAELPQMRIVTATGVPLPDGTTVTPREFSTATDGDTAYLSGPTPYDSVLVHEIDKRPHVVLRTDDPSPSGDGTVGEFGAFEMTPARLLFQVYTSNPYATLLLTHDESGIHSVFEQWVPDLDLERFELEDTNARGDALLSHHPMYEGVHGFTLVLNGPEGIGEPIPVVRDGDPIPSVPGSVFDLSAASAYLDDDGQVVFESGFSGGTIPGTGVFFMPGDSTYSTSIEQVMVPFPGELDGTEWCCNLVGVSDDGVIGIIGGREYGDRYLFVGKPSAMSLALTVPIEGLPVPNAPQSRLPELNMSSAAVGRGGEFVWTSQLHIAEPGGIAGYAVLTYAPDIGLQAVAIEGTPAPGGGSFPHYFTSLAANGRGGVQFTANQTVYRSSRTDQGITLERLGGPTDAFEGPDGMMVTAQEVDSHLDSRAFEAGRVALTIKYGADSTMTLVDGEPLPEPPESCQCRAGGGRAMDGQFAPIALLGLSLLGRSRRRASRLSCSPLNP